MTVGFEPARLTNVCARFPNEHWRQALPSVAAAIEKRPLSDMEVAESQWRREWAGTAEYGKVVEGGVTRRVARAMEVLNASGPGAKVRVMRAAYHTSAGPGLPASSYTMHASRRVFSSGFNFLEPPPSLPTKPLEISSTPFESVPDLHIDTDIENYKVTEPDDFEISEPSKWKSSKGGSMRMPSEESSSTDNASIIDLDPRTNHKNILRKYSCDSENSDVTHSGRNSRVSPLLDAPVSLSTLKFKSLLNGSNEWNSRRKSYSFEDTSPLSDSILHSNDTLAMESSTDSGICKSSEIVNDHLDDNTHLRYFDSKEKEINKQDDSFQSWLSRNRQNNNYYKGPKFKSYREHEVVTEDPAENNITLQSTGKVSITLPIKVETDDGYHYQKNYMSEDGQRKVKKVEFCKTELHFTVDTGKVNIIATDEKPPPTNDFRKRRSAFVPMHEMVEKPITLFGEKSNDFSDMNQRIDSLKNAFSELNESDENTAATKSILKNKIPKPKPYLLGENMTFGSEEISQNGKVNDAPHVLTAVSLINKQLQSEERCDNEIGANFIRNDAVIVKNDAFGAINQGLQKPGTPKDETYGFRAVKTQKVVKIQEEHNLISSSKNFRYIKRSPTPGRHKTRELRESDLTYFGIDNQPKIMSKDKPYSRQMSLDDSDLDEFQSVKLIQQVSSSVCDSETEDAPEYINIPFNTIYAPVPTPRVRSKFDDKPNQIDEIKVVKPVIAQVRDIKNEDTVTRRSKFRRQEELNFSNRSLSEPRKSKNNFIENPQRQLNQPARCIREQTIRENVDVSTTQVSKTTAQKARKSEIDVPIYANLKKSEENNTPRKHKSNIDSYSRKTMQQDTQNKKDSTTHRSRKLETPTSSLGRSTDKVVTRKTLKGREADTQENNNKKNSVKQEDNTNKTGNSSLKKTNTDLHDLKKSNGLSEKKQSIYHDNTSKLKKEHNSRSPHRHRTRDVAKEAMIKGDSSRNKQDSLRSKSTGESETNTNDSKLRQRPTSKDQTSTRTETVKIMPKVDNSTTDKSTTSRDVKPRHSSKSRKNEYVINYDDKNGTVSSVRKLRSGSDSPRRKKTTKEVVKEKFKENLKLKTSDKAALLQPEDHQRNVYSGERKRKSKVHAQRSCQML